MTLLTPPAPQIQTVIAHHSFPPSAIAARRVLTPTEVNESAGVDLPQQKLSFPSP